MAVQKKPIVLTIGEPAGIGPDLAVMLAQNPQVNERIVIAGSSEVLQARATLLDLPLSIRKYPLDYDTPPASGELIVHSIDTQAPVAAGTLNSDNSQYVLQTLDFAISGCLSGEFASMVTGPLHKGVINDAGIEFTGHTEYLAQKTNAWPVMMLATDTLRVALATTHLPLTAVANAITADRLEKVLQILNSDLQTYFGIKTPHILVCGLNPHAGEGGHLGREEIEIIEPVLKKMQQHGMHLTGPLPADTLFTPRHLDSADAVLAMYHDQGLPVLKYSGFGNAVNITLGLPLLRTSVDHGTALDLAGTGKIDTGSLLSAITMSTKLS